MGDMANYIAMAIPVFGGMVFEIITMLVVPVLYSMTEEMKFKTRKGKSVMQ